MSSNKQTNQNANKDLSCLRCRKKKAKCSKTRPTCARCERSNVPCEYPDAPPNLTDLSKKVLDLYDSLRDLEGEFLFKYMQRPSEHDDDTADTLALEAGITEDGVSSAAPIAVVTGTITEVTPSQLQQRKVSGSPLTVISSPQPPLPSSLPATVTATAPATIAPVVTKEVDVKQREVSWSMSYLSEGISIQATTHTVGEFIVFVDKLTRQLFHDLGTEDPSLSTYWDLDHSAHDLYDDGEEEAEGEEEEEEELEEDAYLVTVPIFTTSYFILSCQENQPLRESSPFSTDIPSFNTHLTSMLQYVYTQLNYLDTNPSVKTSATQQLTLLIDQLKYYLPPNSIDKPEQNIDSLTTVYLGVIYLTFQTFFPKQQHTMPMAITIAECYVHVKSLLTEIMLQVAPTHGICLAVILLTWCRFRWQQQGKSQPQVAVINSVNDGDGCLLLDLAWRTFATCLWRDLRSTKVQAIGASLICLDVYASTFQRPYYSMTSHLVQDVGLTLRQRLSISLSELLQKREGEEQQQSQQEQVEKDNNNTETRRLICVLLESQLMWFLHQVFVLFYTNDSKGSSSWIIRKGNHDNDDDNVEHVCDDQCDELEVRKVDVDDVLTLVRDLEQWEQQLPKWATWQSAPLSTTATISAMTTATLEDQLMTMDPMTRQLHLALNVIKILLFRPFCTRFKQYGIEQTYTKTTFLDLSMHSADRLATCLVHQRHEKKHDPLDDWGYAAHQMILDVVDRVKLTFDCDLDIKDQLDLILHRIDPSNFSSSSSSSLSSLSPSSSPSL